MGSSWALLALPFDRQWIEQGESVVNSSELSRRRRRCQAGRAATPGATGSRAALAPTAEFCYSLPAIVRTPLHILGSVLQHEDRKRALQEQYERDAYPKPAKGTV